MGDTLITIVVIGLGAILLFVFPLISASEMNDSEVLAMVQSYTTEFTSNARMEGKITPQMYDEFVQKLNATGNTYDIEIEVHNPDNNAKKKENIHIGDTTSFYIDYTSQIMNELGADSSYLLQEGDYIVVYVKNTNTLISEMFKVAIYGISHDTSAKIVAQASGLVAQTGN